LAFNFLECKYYHSYILWRGIHVCIHHTVAHGDCYKKDSPNLAVVSSKVMKRVYVDNDFLSRY